MDDLLVSSRHFFDFDTLDYQSDRFLTTTPETRFGRAILLQSVLVVDAVDSPRVAYLQIVLANIESRSCRTFRTISALHGP